MPLRFREGRYVVTGAASGIGLATAAALVAEGLDVVLVDRDEAKLAEAVEGLPRQGGSVSSHRVDVSSQADVAALVEHLSDRPVAGVANVAGVFHREDVATVTTETWDRMLAVNLSGSFWLCQSFSAPMRHTGGGAIVLTSSMTGRTSSRGVGAGYVASKAGVIGLTMSLGVQLAPDGIRVNAVAPGKVDTPMFAAGNPGTDLSGQGTDVPLGRVGSPDEIADCISFLLSDNSSYVTGETLNVNGGMFTI